jgi:hypothetical protein
MVSGACRYGKRLRYAPVSRCAAKHFVRALSTAIATTFSVPAYQSHRNHPLQCFNAEQSVRFGVEEAAVILLVQDWIGFNLAMGLISINGRTETSATVDGFTSHMRFLNVRRMRDARVGLVGTGVLDKLSISTRTGRMLGYAFQNEEGFPYDWLEKRVQRENLLASPR